MLNDIDENHVDSLKEIYRILKTFFSYDETKILIWLFSYNQNLHSTPAKMIMLGQSHKLVIWMKNQIEGNFR